MGKHIPPFDNHNEAIIDVNDDTTPLCYFNHVRLAQGETFDYMLDDYETVVVLAGGTCSVTVTEQNGQTHAFDNIGQRESVWTGNPESVYVPVGMTAKLECVSDHADIMIAGGRFEETLSPFCVRQNDVDIVQYGSDDTKTHRKIKHVLGQSNADKRGRLLVSELFTVGAGGWSASRHISTMKTASKKMAAKKPFMKRCISSALTRTSASVLSFYMNMKTTLARFTTCVLALS